MTMMNPRDPDSVLIVVFRNMAIKNESKSAQEGRDIYGDVEVCDIRGPGSKNFSTHPANEVCGWVGDSYTGGQRTITYAERFRHQYNQFKEHAAQTVSGTPLERVAFLTEGKRAELRSVNIYTIEALAHIDGQELKNLGHNGRELKNQAEAFIENARHAAPDTRAVAENEALRAQKQSLADEVDALKKRLAESEGETETQFDAMSNDQLQDYIAANTGRPVKGNLPRKTLVRMAGDMRPKTTEAA